MKHIMCALLPNWPIDRLSRKLSGPRRDATGRTATESQITSPLVLVRSLATRQLVLAVCGHAARYGIRPGMTLAQAHALCAHLIQLEHHPAADRRALEALARWLMRFSPVVALQSTTGVPPVSQKPDPGHLAPPTALFLDLTGCQRLFHGLENLLQQVRDALARFRITAHLAIAPTPGAAWALAFAQSQIANSQSQIATCKSQIPSLLSPLPPAALRLDHHLLRSLHHLGLCTIGQILALPRESLPARFGPTLLLRLDQALGNIPEPLAPLPSHCPIQARMDFDGNVTSLEALCLVFQNLLQQIITQLIARGQGARRLDIDLLQAYAPPIHKTLLLSRPSRDPLTLFNLFRCVLEIPEEGFCALHLKVVESQSLSQDQLHLLDHEEHARQQELCHLIDLLRLRLGDDAVAHAELVQSHLPEKAWRKRSGLRVQGSVTAACGLAVRPLHLLPIPHEIPAIVSPSDDRQGRPVFFTHARTVHRLLHAVGPERIAGLWWQGHHKTRDYFDVEDQAGRRFWIFRVMETGKWFLHGMFQ